MSNRDDALGGKSNHLQQIFNKVSTHLLEQNERSVVDTTGTCAYRGESGKMCAVGCLMADDKYHDGCEGHTVHSGGVMQILAGSGIEFDYQGDVLHLLEVLQKIHDNHPVKDWAYSLDKLAQKFNYNAPHLRGNHGFAADI